MGYWQEGRQGKDKIQRVGGVPPHQHSWGMFSKHPLLLALHSVCSSVTYISSSGRNKWLTVCKCHWGAVLMSQIHNLRTVPPLDTHTHPSHHSPNADGKATYPQWWRIYEWVPFQSPVCTILGSKIPDSPRRPRSPFAPSYVECPAVGLEERPNHSVGRSVHV